MIFASLLAEKLLMHEKVSIYINKKIISNSKKEQIFLKINQEKKDSKFF